MELTLVPTILIVSAVFIGAIMLSICMLAVFKARNFVRVKSFTKFFLLSYAIAMFITVIFSLLLFNQ
jgi:hypothetical protein